MPTNSSPLDPAAFAQLARDLLGSKPTSETKTELRFGTRGSLVFDLIKGTWFDHKANAGGGTLDFVGRETGISEPAAQFEWLKQKGYLNGESKPNGKAKSNGAARAQPKQKPKGKFVKAYPYRDENSTVLFEVVRFEEPKDFRQRKPDGKGGYISSVEGVRRVPYRLDELQDRLDNVIVIPEGEKDCDKLWELGIPATTNAGGANKWHDDLTEFCEGGDFVIVPDNDDAGRDHAADVAAKLSKVAKRVRVLELRHDWPDMPMKGDVSNWFDNGGTPERLYELIEACPVWSPPQASNDINPIDLWGSFDPPELPKGLLPEEIESYAFAQGRTMGADPGGIAMAALAVCAAAIPDRIKLVMKPGDNWLESARLWVALVGPPSAKKSPIITATMGPLARLDAILVNKYLADLREWEQLEPAERKLKQKPAQKRHRLEDTTIEGAQEALAGSPDGLLLVQDEMSSFFGSMDKYGGNRGALKDRGFWLQAFNGGTYALNRINRGVSMIPNLSINLLGGIQPDVIRRIAGESLDDGFLQRMFMIMLRPATVGLNAATQSTSSGYNLLVERLTKLKMPVSGSWNSDNDGILRFNNRAQDARGRLEKRHLDLAQAIETFNGKLAAHLGKYDGLFGRLCVLFHCIENSGDRVDRLATNTATSASGESHWTAPRQYRSDLPEFISDDTAERVEKFMHQYLLPHAFAFYGGVLKLADDHDRLINVAGFILTRPEKTVLTNRDVQMGCRTMRDLERRDIESVFEQLSALGWVTMTPGPRKTDPPHWEVNPAVHQKFTERASSEAERRKKVREIITTMRGVEKC